jgi:hypothetical protein
LLLHLLQRSTYDGHFCMDLLAQLNRMSRLVSSMVKIHDQIQKTLTF